MSTPNSKLVTCISEVLPQQDTARTEAGLDREVIEEKLESLRRCVQRVSQKCPSSVEALLDDFDLQDILVLNLSRAVQLCVDIAAHWIAESEIPPAETMGSAFDALVWQRV